jgi:dCMP deaminase
MTINGDCGLNKRDGLWWHRYFLEMAKHVSTASKDPSTQVGAVIVNNRRQVVGMGYNGFARGVNDTPERLNDRPTKYKMVVHAEQNALIQAGHAAQGGTIYVYPSFWHPNICHDCAKLAIQAGIGCVVGYKADENNPRIANWKESLELSGQMFKEAGVEWFSVDTV